MINRCEFERYLTNKCHCWSGHGTDATLCHKVNGITYHATLGNHEKQKIRKSEARKFLQKLGFANKECKEILEQF